jgi:hypothetical protein
MSHYVKVNINIFRVVISVNQSFLLRNLNLPRDAMTFKIMFFILTPAIFYFEI